MTLPYKECRIMKCPMCNEEMTWNSDEDASEMTEDEYQL